MYVTYGNSMYINHYYSFFIFRIYSREPNKVKNICCSVSEIDEKLKMVEDSEDIDSMEKIENDPMHVSYYYLAKLLLEDQISLISSLSKSHRLARERKIVPTLLTVMHYYHVNRNKIQTSFLKIGQRSLRSSQRSICSLKRKD